MKNYLILGFVAMMLSLISCNDENNNAPLETKKEFNLIGNAQKGPFINGSDVNIYELDTDFKPTGRTFHANTDEKGHFELKGIELVSPYVELLADGFYYNEVTGKLSGERMILKAIIDLTEQNNININVLTNLEFERVKYLIASKGSSIRDAKIQAQKELLKVFSMDSIQIDNAETLDIVNPGEEDAVLLAVSSILQANRSTAELSKLQADIILDMKEDGLLGDTIIQSSLIDQSLALNLDAIRQNLVSKYTELGIVLSNINNFDKYVKYFNAHTNFQYNSLFNFPESTANGINILALNSFKFEANTIYPFAAKMPTVGKLKVRIKLIDGMGPFYQTNVNHGWKVGAYDFTKNEMTLTSTLNGEIIDLQLLFETYGAATIEYYYNEALTPTRTKTISWGPYNNSRFLFGDSPAGKNLLAMNDGSEIKTNTPYVIGVYDNAVYLVKFKVKFPATVSLQTEGGYGTYTGNIFNDRMELELASTVFPPDMVGGTSEIIVKFKGTGEINIESDLQFHDGHLLKKTFTLKE
jgi:hypothetical protein